MLKIQGQLRLELVQGVTELGDMMEESGNVTR